MSVSDTLMGSNLLQMQSARDVQFSLTQTSPLFGQCDGQMQQRQALQLRGIRQ
jgi:hypothetical protein